MKKMLSLILAILMVTAIITTAYADGTTPSTPGPAYLVEKIQANAQFIDLSRGLWRWRPELPSGDGKEVWLTFYTLDGNAENGNLNVTLRTEGCVYYLALMLGATARTKVQAADDPTLPDEFLIAAADDPTLWDNLETRDGNVRHYISGQFKTNSYVEGTEPRIELYSNISNDVQEVRASQLYRDATEMIVWMLDAWQYELKPAYGLSHLFYYCATGICRWHEWDEGNVYDPPTTGHAGHIIYHCLRCQKAHIEIVPRLRFEDVPENAYYSEAVDWATENGVVAGTSETDFSPNAECTRAQIVQMLWRSAGSPEAETETPFTDVPPTAYYAEAVAWAYENGITTGTGTATFSPNNPCTRAQIVTMLWRANGSPESSVQTRFADVNGSEWYADSVKWAAENGITAGKRENAFAAFDICTRAEAVTFLWEADGGEEQE